MSTDEEYEILHKGKCRAQTAAALEARVKSLKGRLSEAKSHAATIEDELEYARTEALFAWVCFDEALGEIKRLEAEIRREVPMGSKKRKLREYVSQ
ncbi:hypothetical protein PMZ80_005760 [Knufia obscura]|uniref:Uncharacterized protein n=2 Tax=Knufia TaxID=430999 RepID=A0AAN8I8D3_9EURO|nr:hypothetical protein PMZ80_005760 [Knufia obscura]KAK5954426.1 hypothetical protein OHC33_004148 [Knufia fluminis]